MPGSTGSGTADSWSRPLRTVRPGRPLERLPHRGRKRAVLELKENSGRLAPIDHERFRNPGRPIDLLNLARGLMPIEGEPEGVVAAET